MCLPVYNLAQQMGPLPLWGRRICVSYGMAIWFWEGSGIFFLRNKYSGQVMSKNKINILSRNDTKQNTSYIDDW